MTTADTAAPLDEFEGGEFEQAPKTTREQWWERTENFFERVSERLNPILVKESRQALKSMHFVVTFSLLMLCAWAWTFISMLYWYSDLGEWIYYESIGNYVLAGYAVILIFPVCLVVPFAAFRSLAAEMDDGTFELVSITSLSARQIVTGKLGSAIVQTIVYFSALGPCIAFTYLLRGLDVFAIVALLSQTFFASVTLSAFGLMLATVARNPLWNVMLSIGLLFTLAGVILFAPFWVVMWLTEGEASAPFQYHEFWLAMLCPITIELSFIALFIYSGAAQISFESDNRSTKLRVIMFVQQLLIMLWWMWGWLESGLSEMLVVMFCFSGVYWMFMGGLMAGEQREISPRVQRKLPQSLLGRAAFTWFFPGPATGYLFVITTLFALFASTMLFAAASTWLPIFSSGSRPNVDDEHILFGAVMFCYVASYLGVTRALVELTRNVMYVSLFLAFVLNVFLAIMGVVIPGAIHIAIAAADPMGSGPEFSLLEATNWGVTLGVTANGDLFDAPLVPAVLVLFTMLTIAFNVVLASRELTLKRVAAPVRVQEDEAELHPPVEEVEPQSPWDD